MILGDESPRDILIAVRRLSIGNLSEVSISQKQSGWMIVLQ
ncbi:hypothetical protein QFZ20_002100 [Flavobacterium sp. W4I14]|nr:hypothetical protein [Flavobacterium sp. W4I14]